MNIDRAKEIFQTGMNNMNQTHHSIPESQLFLRDKQAWENAIATYKGNDPLELWFNYICWYDYNIHIDPENKFGEILEKCLTIFEQNEIYTHDVRMVKLWVKYIDLKSNPLDFYQVLYQRGIGTQCASFYIGWAHYYDSANAFKQAESVYNLGFQAKAEPYSELQEAHTKFRLSVSQRMLYNDSSSKKRSANNLIEQRQQITALHLSASTNQLPKKSKIEQFDFGDCPSYTSQQMNNGEQQDAYLNPNNQYELNNSTYLMSSSFSHDESKIPNFFNTQYIEYPLENVKLPDNFAYYTRNNCDTWKPLLFLEEFSEEPKSCIYQKNLVYPGGGMEYSPEEIRARKWIQKMQLYRQSYMNGQQRIDPETGNFNGEFNEMSKIQYTTQYPTNQIQNNSNKIKNNNFENQYDTETSESSDYMNQNHSGHIFTSQNGEVHCFQQSNSPQNEYNNSFQQCFQQVSNSETSDSRIHYASSTITSQTSNSKQSLQDYTPQNFPSVPNLDESHLNAIQTDNRFLQYSSSTHNSTNTQQQQTPKENSSILTELLNEDYFPSQPTSAAHQVIDLTNLGEEEHQSESDNDQKEFEDEAKEETKERNSFDDASYFKDEKRRCYTNSKANKIKNNHDDYSDSEEQIEASTIRFSTDSNGATKNKTITIKFRKEAPSNHHSTDSSRSSSSSNKHNRKKHITTLNGGASHHQLENNSSSVDCPGVISSTSSTKERKIKRIKIINNYGDLNTKSEGDDGKSKHASYTTVSRNQYEDANLLLSLAQTPSTDSNTFNHANLNNSRDTDSVCNDDSASNTDFNISVNESSNFTISNCSTPQRKLSQLYSKSSTVTSQNFRNLKGLTTNVSLQNDDSMCSYEQNSFFAVEGDEELIQRRLSKALNTIESHLAKPAVDPFSNELCKAFLTKINFPSREDNNTYKLVDTPISKLANTKSTVLADITYNIEKEVGRGSYGSVYKAVNVNSGAVVALKYQKPPNTWEVYICSEVRKRMKNYQILGGFMNISSAVIAPNASIIITEFSVYGSLLDINNKIRQATKKVMHESLAMHFSIQILDIVNHLHSCKIIHADIKPDNFLLMKVPNTDSHVPSLRLIDFGCAIDMTLFPDKMQFKKVIQTDGFTCVEMQEGRPWSYQTDLFCTAGTIHVMLFGEYMQLVKKFGQWDIKQKLPRYLKKHAWTEFFTKMLNIENIDSLPNLVELKNMLDDELSKMDSELRHQIRTLSNILHRR